MPIVRGKAQPSNSAFVDVVQWEKRDDPLGQRIHHPGEMKLKVVDWMGHTSGVKLGVDG